MPDGCIPVASGREGWRNPRPLPSNSEQLASEWKAPDEPVLTTRGGRFVNPGGRNPPLYLYTPRPDDEDSEGGDPSGLPHSDRTYAETIASQYEHRQPNRLPELPLWVTSRFRAFVQTAQLTSEQIRKLLRSPNQAARLLCEHAEAAASGYTLEGEQKPREMQADRAQLLLRGVLEIADEIRGLDRTERDRINARRADVQARPHSRRRTEMLAMYGEILKQRAWQALRPAERQLRREVGELFESVSRAPAPPVTRGGVRCGWYLWDPPETTKNKTVSRTCDETPNLRAPLYVRAPQSSEHSE